MMTDEQAVKLYQAVWGDTGGFNEEELSAIADEVRQMISAPDLATAVDVVRNWYDAESFEALVLDVQDLRTRAGMENPDVLDVLDLMDGKVAFWAADEIRQLRSQLDA